MANVTVIGGNGSTVTPALNSAGNATAAQDALNAINQAVQNALAEQQSLSGSAGFGPSTSFLISGLASGSGTINAGVGPSNLVSLVTTNKTQVSLIGTSSMTVVTDKDSGGIAFGNTATNTKLFIGGGNSLVQSYDKSSLTMELDGKNNVLWDYGKGGSSTISAYDQSTLNVFRGSSSATGGGGGDVFIKVKSGSTTIAQALGDSSLPASGAGAMGALTISGDTGGSINYIGGNGTRAFIQPADGKVVIGGSLGKDGGVTLKGGTGSAIVFANHGYFEGGTGGNNYLITDTLANATTLKAAGPQDTLIGQAGGNTYIGGAGNDFIADLSDSLSGGGASYNSSGGSDTIFGSLSSKNTFNMGSGTVLAYGQTQLTKAGNVFTDAFDGANTIIIGDFQNMIDTFSLTKSTSGASLVSINFVAAMDIGGVGTQAVLTDGTKVYFQNFDITKASFS